MRSSFCSLMVLLAALAAPAQDTQASKPTPVEKAATPLDKVKAIDQEFSDARNAFFKLYSEAKSQEDKQKLFKEKYPKPETFVARLYEIAKSDPKGEGAEAALVWIVTHDQSGKDS